MARNIYRSTIVAVFVVLSTVLGDCPQWSKISSKRGIRGITGPGSDKLWKCKKQCWGQAGCIGIDYTERLRRNPPHQCRLHYKGGNTTLLHKVKWNHYSLHESCHHTAVRCGMPLIKPRLDDPPNTFDEQNVTTLGQTISRPIVSGMAAVPYSWPWMVFVFIHKLDGKIAGCGGSILNERWILTAAHCVGNPNITRVGLAVGTSSLRGIFARNDVQLYKTEKVVFFSHYVDPVYYDDIALIQTKKNITYNAHVQPVCTPEAVVDSGTPCVAIGYGVTQGTLSREFLNQLQLDPADGIKCERRFICVKYRPEKDVCYGDSGSPLSCEVRGLWRQYGIVSRGNKLKGNGTDCVNTDKAAIYSRVYAYKDWIIDTTKDFTVGCPRWSKLQSKRGVQGHNVPGSDTLTKCQEQCWGQAGCIGVDYSERLRNPPHQCRLHYKGGHVTLLRKVKWDHYRLDKSCHHAAARCGMSLIKPIELNETEPSIGQQMSAVPDSWPWMVFIVKYNKDRTPVSACGGSILNERWILTAAHCIERLNATSVGLALGYSRIRYGYCTQQSQRHLVDRIVVHPNRRPGVADIALIKTKDNIKFSPRVQPVCLPRETIDGDTPCVVIGYGREQDALVRNVLNQHQMYAVNTTKCAPDMMCMKFRTETNICYADSGSPLSCQFDGVWRQYGIIRGGRLKGHRNCVNTTSADNYTSVYGYMGWIQTVTFVWGKERVMKIMSCSAFTKQCVHFVVISCMHVLWK